MLLGRRNSIVLPETSNGARVVLLSPNTRRGAVKNYVAIEIGILAGLTTAFLGSPELGGIWVVVPIMVLAWVTLQLVSSVAFCNALHQANISVYRGPRGSRETYGLAQGAKPGWLVMRHVWMYSLFPEPKISPNGPAEQR